MVQAYVCFYERVHEMLSYKRAHPCWQFGDHCMDKQMPAVGAGVL